MQWNLWVLWWVARASCPCSGPGTGETPSLRTNGAFDRSVPLVFLQVVEFVADEQVSVRIQKEHYGWGGYGGGGLVGGSGPPAGS